MSDRPRESAAQDALPLPDAPSLEWLRKRAKRRLAELRASRPDARLADAQRDLARRHGFSSWRALAAHVASSDASRRAFEAAKAGDVAALRALLDAQPGLLQARSQPYEHTLLHAAAFAGRLEVVDLLLQRGLDPNVRERGDETYPMHWAAAAGHVAVVERLIAAGGDVGGEGDDHELGLIGWAACWDGADDDAHRRVAELLVAHGARH
ncbi:MAG TPA: ankyrin repeat domain-containing protein, partial [Gemmatimonadaceae bacterium]|nr:ankyrin repeat domain-containing protein [Gemmatimonadaceae bacterium]